MLMKKGFLWYNFENACGGEGMIRALFFDLDGTLLPMDLDEFIQTYFGLLAQRLPSTGIISTSVFLRRFLLTFVLLFNVENNWSTTFWGFGIPVILYMGSPVFVRISSRPKTTVPPRVFVIAQ